MSTISQIDTLNRQITASMQIQQQSTVVLNSLPLGSSERDAQQIIVDKNTADLQSLLDFRKSLTGVGYQVKPSEANAGQPSIPTNNQSIGIQKIVPIGESAYPNVLHDYASYSYNISLHTISIEKYNSFSAHPKTGYTPDANSVLIASAGRWDNTDRRNNHFKDADFFFDKMTFETVIGSTEYAQNSNVLAIDFTIIEPYGMTLANRLLDLASDYSKVKDNKSIQDNVFQLPYLLQIDFFGVGNDGISKQIENVSKYIPIQIISAKFKVSLSGSQWDFTAVPYNHQAFTDTVGSTPMKCQVYANSIKDFFAAVPTGTASVAAFSQNAVNAASTIFNQKEVDQSAARIKLHKDLASHYRTAPEDQVQEKVAINQISTLVKQSSYPTAVNLWHQVNQKIGACKIADEFAFTIDPLIINAQFQPKELVSITSLAMLKGNTDQANLFAQSGQVTNMDDSNHPVVVTTINQGTSILNVINTAMLNTDYVHSQIIDPTHDTNITVEKMKSFLEKPLNWYHIVPSVKILGYDTINNRYAKKITYNIQHKILYQDKDKNSYQGQPAVIAKDYEYIFTGKNNDILNFDLDFNSQFFIVNVANPSNADVNSAAPASAATPSQQLLNQDANKVLTSAQVASILNDVRANGRSELKPKVHLVAAIPTTSATRGGKAEMVKQLERNILSTVAGDLLSVTLKIIGDPDFIKQDDIFFTLQDMKSQTRVDVNGTKFTDNRKTPNGSIATDLEDLFVRLTFKTASDYDINGLAIPKDSTTNKYASSMFSGLYKITKVNNYFTNGRFEQELHLYHYNLQPTPGVSTGADQTQSSNRESSVKKISNGAIIGAPASKLPATDTINSNFSITGRGGVVAIPASTTTNITKL